MISFTRLSSIAGQRKPGITVTTVILDKTTGFINCVSVDSLSMREAEDAKRNNTGGRGGQLGSIQT